MGGSKGLHGETIKTTSNPAPTRTIRPQAIRPGSVGARGRLTHFLDEKGNCCPPAGRPSLGWGLDLPAPHLFTASGSRRECSSSVRQATPAHIADREEKGTRNLAQLTRDSCSVIPPCCPLVCWGCLLKTQQGQGATLSLEDVSKCNQT